MAQGAAAECRELGAAPGAELMLTGSSLLVLH